VGQQGTTVSLELRGGGGRAKKEPWSCQGGAAGHKSVSGAARVGRQGIKVSLELPGGGGRA
jgi:hypothetical protein